MPSLFSASLFRRKAVSEVVSAPHCNMCLLYKKCKTPKMAVYGKGQRGIMVVGSHPSKADDDSGRPFAGIAGRVFRDQLQAAGINPLRDCWFTSAAVCAPREAGTPNQAIDHCRPLLVSNIKERSPSLIILVGAGAVRGVIGHVWKEDVGEIDRWVGRKIPGNAWNSWICPVWQTTDFTATEDARKTADVRRVLQASYLEQIADIPVGDRPWGEDGAPDFESQVECIEDPTVAAAAIREITAKGGYAAFDYETTCLKPDGKHARIVCCSICWMGKKTIAYPWTPETAAATREFVSDPRIHKIGANIKFEQRWTLAHLGIPVINWAWDCMQSAHVDNVRRRTTSIKFQSFVRFGMHSYNEDIEPFLRSSKKDRGNNAPNRIHEIPLRRLLMYCGLDSLLEFIVANDQAKKVGRNFYVKPD